MARNIITIAAKGVSQVALPIIAFMIISFAVPWPEIHAKNFWDKFLMALSSVAVIIAIIAWVITDTYFMIIMIIIIFVGLAVGFYFGRGSYSEK